MKNGSCIALDTKQNFSQAPESTTLANFAKSYQEIAQLKPFPADIGSLHGWPPLWQFQRCP